MRKRTSLLSAAATWLALTVGGHASETGTISGNVSNAATGNLLAGARVEIVGSPQFALTDATGRYELSDVAPGDQQLIATYTGLDSERATVVVANGARARRDFNLSTQIYTLQAMTVSGEREGAAAAITAQRNANNIKNVVDMDSYGTMSNMSASEMVIRLPGVAGNLSGSGAGLVDGFTVRGMGPGLNNVTVDGGMLTSQNAMSRSANINNITGGMFEQIELVKGQTPDKSVDSLGGTVNLKTRSPLRMKEKRRIIYNTSVRHAPSFTEQIPLRENHRSHPLFSVTYQEVFDVLGSERNLGVAVSGFYSENVQGFYKITRDYQVTEATPAYVWDYRTEDNYNNRMHASLSAKAHYRHSPNTLFTLSASINDTRENRRIANAIRAYTSNSTGSTGTAGVLPGYTNDYQQVRASTASNIDITSNGQNWMNRLRNVDVGGEHTLGSLFIDYTLRHSQTHLNSGNDRAGDLMMRINNVGWILDRRDSDLFPRFIQTEGPDFTNPANYRPAANGLVSRKVDQDQDIDEAKINARLELPWAAPTFLKTGAAWRYQTITQAQSNRRWSYIGTTPLPTDPTFLAYDTVKTERKLPFWEAKQFLIDGRTPSAPSLWNEDRYYHEAQNYLGLKSVSETITAAYIMAEGKLGRGRILENTGYVTGVRVERTDTESGGWVRARNASTVAQQVADPVGAAKQDYANTRRDLEGKYTQSFPSVHLTHDLTGQVKLRASWSTSFGRPGLTNLLPNESISEINQTLTVNNAELLPQRAENWDAMIEYYFEPAGYLAAGWFHKTISDYIVTGINVGTVATGPDNGYDGEYSGFTKLTSLNAGTAYVQGWELNYSQQFTFLPGVFKGLGASGNFTTIETHGDFGGLTYLKSGQVAGFIPRTGNASLYWRHRALGARVLYNYTSDYTSSYSRTSPAASLFRKARSVYSVSLSYQLNPAVTLSLDVENLTNEPQIFYRGYSDRIFTYVRNGITLNMGLSGRF